MTLPPVHSTNLTHTEACWCVAHQFLHHQLKQSIQSLHALTICSCTISPLISILACSVYLEMCILSSNRIRYWLSHYSSDLIIQFYLGSLAGSTNISGKKHKYGTVLKWIFNILPVVRGCRPSDNLLPIGR